MSRCTRQPRHADVGGRGCFGEGRWLANVFVWCVEIDPRIRASIETMLDWGSVPEWFAAVGTVAALGVAAFAYRHDVWHRQRAQARLITIGWHLSPEPVKLTAHKTTAAISFYGGNVVGPLRFIGEDGNLRPIEDGWLHGLIIRNASDEMLPEARVMVGDEVYSLPRGGAVGPEESEEVAFAYPGPKLHFLPGVAFMDSTGRWWRRLWTFPIERATEIDKDERKRRKILRADARRFDRLRTALDGLARDDSSPDLS